MAQRSESVPEIAYYANGTIRIEGFLLDGEFHGAWEWYRLDGTLMRTGQFDRRKQVEIWRTRPLQRSTTRRASRY